MGLVRKLCKYLKSCRFFLIVPVARPGRICLATNTLLEKQNAGPGAGIR